MAMIGHLVETLIVVVLLGNLTQMVLPKGDIKRYSGLVVGLVVLAVMVQPIWSLMGQLHRVNPTGWAVSQTSDVAFNQMAETEELHQASAMVLQLGGVKSCRLRLHGSHRVSATVVASSQVSDETIRHYVSDALQVTTGARLHLELRVVRPAPHDEKPSEPSS